MSAALRAASLALLVALVGCTGAPTRIDPDLQAAAWRSRAAALAALAGWRASGRVALETAEDSWSASLTWTQQAEAFRIRLGGPLGQGLMEIEGVPGRVVLRRSGEPPVLAGSADALLRERTGWSLPVSGLRYWLVGLAEPAVAPDRLQLDERGRPTRLEQRGWTVRYLRYERFGELDLPTRLELSTRGVSARLALRRWRL